MGESLKVSEDASETESELDNNSETESESVVMTVKGLSLEPRVMSL